jgi:putative radical SAM enzyme (TIGR03279 family)
VVSDFAAGLFVAGGVPRAALATIGSRSLMSPVTLSPLSHRRVDLTPSVPGLVESVSPASLAMELGIEPGDQIIGINGQPLLDALDFQFQAQAERVILDVDRNGVLLRYDLQLDGDEFWGVTFSDPTFDGVRVCENSCPFCFIKQIPKGMRRSLYVMDDDYRYSMLYGSFVTLTNLSEEDWQRIEEQHISPLHVSVHSTNPELRQALVGNPKGGDILGSLARLERAGIDFHAQFVLVPGVNDGDEMERSLRDLSTFERLRSIAGVPVGLSRHGQERQSKQLRLSRTCMRTLPGKQVTVRRYQPDEARAVIKHAETWQERFWRERGNPFFYLGDEFYLMSGTPVPDTEHYGGFPQIEDGIGITRAFLDNLDAYLRRSRRGLLEGAQGTIACAELIAPTMREAVASFNARTGADLEVVMVENVYLGSEINVSGLLSGHDLLAAFDRHPSDAPLYISDRMVSQRTGTLLDDRTVEDVETELRRPVVPAGDLAAVARDLRQRRARQAPAAA